MLIIWKITGVGQSRIQIIFLNSVINQWETFKLNIWTFQSFFKMGHSYKLSQIRLPVIYSFQFQMSKFQLDGSDILLHPIPGSIPWLLHCAKTPRPRNRSRPQRQRNADDVEATTRELEKSRQKGLIWQGKYNFRSVFIHFPYLLHIEFLNDLFFLYLRSTWFRKLYENAWVLSNNSWLFLFHTLVIHFL